MNKLSRLALAAGYLLALSADVHAQSSCSSDGQPQPTGILERFTNADCDTCWGDARTARPAPAQLALDWIVPGSRGDDAPLSAAATRDATARLQQLGRHSPARADAVRGKIAARAHKVRVAHGLPFNGYIGTSIELKPGRGGPFRAWLLLVETVPAGVQGTPVERNLVRNAIQPPWDGSHTLSKEEQQRLYESRPMSIPEGADPKRLRVVGWVEDARGKIVAAAQSRCRQQR